MREMKMENERIELPVLQQFGDEWIRAIIDGDLDRLHQFCHPALIVRLLVPSGLKTLDNAANLVAKYRAWFGECSDFQVEASRIAPVGEKLGIFYRFLLQKNGDRYAIEQQLYCTLKDGRVQQLDLLCSGFQPVKMNDLATRVEEAASADEAGQPDPKGDALLEFYSAAAEAGSTCAVLTPMIRSKLREMQSGQVLEVIVDDPSARGDVEAWSRLSGNGLLKVIDNQGQILRFFVQKK